MNANIVTIGGLDCYEENGVAHLNLEQAARGLGFTRIAASGNEVVRWERVNGYLRDFGFVPTSGHDGFIPENIFYRLAMKAKNPAAEKFQAWVADEVIPTIRKHGAYMTPETLENALLNPDFLIQLAERLKAEQEKTRALQAKIDADAPKVLYADAVAGSKTGMLIREFCKFLRPKGVEIGEKRAFADMREGGWLIKTGRDKNKPTQKAVEMGLFTVKETAIQKPSGETVTRTTPLLTGKGRQYFADFYLSKLTPAAEISVT